jgi:hypothetical protein
MPHVFVFLVLAGVSSLTATVACRADQLQPLADAAPILELADPSGTSAAAEPAAPAEPAAAADDNQWQGVPSDQGQLPTAGSELTAAQIELRDRVRRCLAHYFFRPETTRRRSPWGVMHAVIGFGVDTPLIADGRQVNAIAWLCANSPCLGMQMLYEHQGSVALRMGPGYQGHDGQFLCILAQSRVKSEYPLVVNGRRLTVADLVLQEQAECRAGTELTFKLIGLAYYLDPDAQWQNRYGEAWSIERMIREELAQPIVGAACGGTHRLTGFAYAVCKREVSGKPMTGQWQRAQNYLDDFHQYAFQLQNPDGSFSTEWFVRRSTAGDLNRRLNTTGHILEWLVYSLTEAQLAEQRTVRAVEYLTEQLWRYRDYDWDIGAKGHAIHALALYDERLFAGRPGTRAEQLAEYHDDAERRAAVAEPERRARPRLGFFER